jgi:two-component system, cell cycle response regulator DivK
MSRTLLLIEDNEQNRYLVTYLMQSRGWEVIHAADGPSGIDKAREFKPVLILLDIQLPGMDGYEVAAKLRADSTLAELPIIAVTSYAMPGDRERCLDAGCTGYIEKPINPSTFADEVESFLEDSS